MTGVPKNQYTPEPQFRDDDITGKGQPVEWAATFSFEHIKSGNFSHTEKAVGSYLRSQGFPVHGHTAELIMFMERSFAGKYRNGERSHYQRVMPSACWRVGDSLSEKLTRCRDKETFKARFDRIGTTGVLRAHHFEFETYKITNLDFEGRLYLRLIDTTKKNISWFYRNDSVVENFLSQAHIFHAAHSKAARSQFKPEAVYWGKADAPEPGKAGIQKLENPNSLLFKGLNIEESKGKRTPLTLIYSSPEKKESIQGRDRQSERGPGTPESKKAVRLGRVTPHEHGIPEALAFKERVRSGDAEVHRLWREATMFHHPRACITDGPTKKLIGQAGLLGQKFGEFFPHSELAEFFIVVADRWPALKASLKQEGVWQTLAGYPEIPQLLEFSDKVLAWYKGQGITSQVDVKTPKMSNSHVVQPVLSPMVPPYAGCERITAAGRTFSNDEHESLEYQIAFLSMSDKAWSLQMASVLRELLTKKSINLPASTDRIQELRELQHAVLATYCC